MDKRTAKGALLQFIAEYHQGLNELAGRGDAIGQTLQQLLADILSLPCLQDEGLGTTSAYVNVGAFKNMFREELRKALTAYFMGGDVGVDGGSSQDAVDAKGGRT